MNPMSPIDRAAGFTDRGPEQPARSAPLATPNGKPDLSGVVVHGDKRGRELGYATANLFVAASSLVEISNGVYAGWAASTHKVLSVSPAAISLGTRPTFYGASGVRLLEVHVLDFHGDLYDRRLSVWLGPFVRTQETFRSAHELSRRIAQDIEKVRAVHGLG